MKFADKVILFVGLFFFGIKSVLAVPPPDFIFNVGAQIAQFFSIAVLFLGAVLATVRQFAKVYLVRFGSKKIIWILLLVGIFGVSGGATYFYGQYEQNVAYQDWLEDSKAQNASTPVSDTSLDQLKLGEEYLSHPKEGLSSEEEDMKFIRTYYTNLGNGNIGAAYAVSKKSVSLATYKDWYKNVTSLTIDDIQKIDENKFSLRLTLKEGEQVTNYGVLMTLTQDAQGNFRVQASDVRVLTATDGISQPLLENSVEDVDFYSNNQTLSLAISNEEFQKVSANNPFILDARENEEYDIGRFPKSTHIRFADLISGEWIRIPTDRVVYIFCWSGIRGKEVADFLRSKKIVARYIEFGADGWVDFGGTWVGGIKFSSQYPEERYQRLVTLDGLKVASSTGTSIVDSRIKEKYDTWHIPGSINIPIIYTPSSKIDVALDQLPHGSSVITVCDDFVSCFDAKITGLKLERKGHEFLGRYNKPWEYRSSQ